MGIGARDREIVKILDYFKQASTSQLRRLVFPDSASRTSCDRALARLERDNYIMKLEKQRPQGGARGGSGEYVWILGREGWRVCGYSGRYRRAGAIDYHTLTITELYVRLREYERRGIIRLKGFQPEPECWLKVNSNELQPDLLVELERGSDGARLTAWIENDLGTQRPARLSEKMERYKRAHDSISHSQLDELGGEFPLIVFVAQDEERKREIAWLIERRADDPRLFRASTLEGFPFDMA